MPEIALGHDRFANVDKEDLELVAQYKWSALVTPWATYAITQGKTKPIYMHRLIMDAPENRQVDHKDGNGLDNRRHNLRIATPKDQAGNTKPRKKRSDIASKYKGVSWRANPNGIGGRWRAEIEIALPSEDGTRKRKRFIKYSLNEDDAARFYNDMAREYYGDFAKINVIS